MGMVEQALALVVGLGNPGLQYARPGIMPVLAGRQLARRHGHRFRLKPNSAVKSADSASPARSSGC